MDKQAEARMRNRYALLIKGCPACGGTASAEAKLPLSAGSRTVELDLDNLADLAARLSLGQLLAVVELVPYKQFDCKACGHSFRLANQTAKDMALAMLGALQPVARAPVVHARGAAPKTPSTETLRKHLEPPKAASRPSPAAQRAADEWEPESLDLGKH